MLHLFVQHSVEAREPIDCCLKKQKNHQWIECNLSEQKIFRIFVPLAVAKSLADFPSLFWMVQSAPLCISKRAIFSCPVTNETIRVAHFNWKMQQTFEAFKFAIYHYLWIPEIATACNAVSPSMIWFTFAPFSRSVVTVCSFPVQIDLHRFIPFQFLISKSKLPFRAAEIKDESFASFSVLAAFVPSRFTATVFPKQIIWDVCVFISKQMVWLVLLLLELGHQLHAIYLLRSNGHTFDSIHGT